MQFLADVHLRCEACHGKRFKPEVLEVTWRGLSVADVLASTVDDMIQRLGPRTAAARRLGPLQDVGLGYLRLGQPLATLSGGEAQRLKLAAHLPRPSGTKKKRRRARPLLFLLDEPTTGLHLQDVDRLIGNLTALIERGHTVVTIEHHLDVVAAADWVIDLGPGGGDRGGRAVFEGPPQRLSEADTATGQHLARWVAGIEPLSDAAANARRGESSEAAIRIEGARVHNLKGIDTTLPRGGRTVISGVSGCGKSSLAFDLVFAEGQRRFLDCLSAYARQYIAQLARPDADRIEGIPPTVAIEQRTTRGGSRSTVANVTEIEPFLRILYARLGEFGGAGVAGDVTPGKLAKRMAATLDGHRITVCAPIVKSRQGLHKKVFARAASMGVDVIVNGRRRQPVPPPRMRRRRHADIDFVMAEVAASQQNAVASAIVAATELGEGQVVIIDHRGARALYDVAGQARGRRAELDPRYFSPRTKLGACATCQGAGALDDGQHCPTCEGERLGPIGRSATLGGRRLPELLRLTPQPLAQFLGGLSLGERGNAVAAGPIRAIAERIAFLLDVGLSYLSLDRGIRTLSGGEAQRIRLAAQLGSRLSGVLYVLDEPTIGLHPTDTTKLLATLDALQARGNGIMIVEHDEMTLRTADVLVDMGPGAGAEGGEILLQGPLETVLADSRSITGRCLSTPRPRARPTPRDTSDARFIALRRMQHNNLAGASLKLPRERLTVITGVSGSGKSSVIELLESAMAQAAPKKGPATPGSRHGVAGRVEPAGLAGLTRFITVDALPIGKNPRSTPATYVGVWDPIRQLFAAMPEAKVRGFRAGRFSFNVKGGRCASCQGQGQIKLEMSFLPDAYVACGACGGRRFNRQTLQVAFDGLAIDEILALSVDAALAVFDRIPKIKNRLQLMADVGLGYLTLGQPSPTLSGGEAQRIKLVGQLARRSGQDTVIVLDEPSVGLHMADVPRLMSVLHRLVDNGATVVVVEHNTDMMREADWIIDMGPGAGAEGGQVVYEGTFDGLLACERSLTGQWLSEGHGRPVNANLG